MYLTDEDKTQYELIEDAENDKILGTAESVIEYLKDMVKYDLKNTDDAETIEDIEGVIADISNEIKEGLRLSEKTIIAIFDNPMCGLDWQVTDYRYL